MGVKAKRKKKGRTKKGRQGEKGELKLTKKGESERQWVVFKMKMTRGIVSIAPKQALLRWE